METLAGFDYIAMHFDGDGKPTSNALNDLLAHVKQQATTDVLLLAHGFRNDERDASRLYDRFLTTFREHLTHARLAPAMASRTFAVGGVMWPAKAFSEGPSRDEGGVQNLGANDELDATRAQLADMRDSDLSSEQRVALDKALAMLNQIESDSDAQDEFVSLVLSLLEDDDDPTEGLKELKAQRGSDLLGKLRAPIILPTRAAGEGGVSSVSAGRAGDDEGKPLFIGGFFKSVAGRVGQLLNVTTWYMMKNRSGTVGSVGVAAAVRALKQLPGGVRVHLVGHSLGGRCMAACAKSLASDPMVQPDSVTLLQAAFSHYGLSENNGRGDRGHFRDVLSKSVVKGPFIATYSYQDTVVGRAYAVSSRLAGQNANAIGDKDDQFGGIGRNGSQRADESTNGTLNAVGTPYTFAPNVLNNLDGSGGRIKDHSDVTNAEVTWAVACAVAAT